MENRKLNIGKFARSERTRLLLASCPMNISFVPKVEVCLMGVCHDIISSLLLVQAFVCTEKNHVLILIEKYKERDFLAYFVKWVHNITGDVN